MRSTEQLERIATQYRTGELLSGELKEIATDRITGFLASHQRRRDALDRLEDELEAYRLTDTERRQALERAGVPCSLRPRLRGQGDEG
ncbi:tryptophanyl-tRNA synthetase [Halobiforma nitratireducens JCM 10879]|uniref:Tryptophanyl-tRNA synthetase n=1 Tax=Halobiforma nitratireducens JCM 10879 TaxID=1227454 RepID=M0MQ66_9EURY|nr:tryptophanyl-tRNA synthetase [Halobiforma nitratireducens JCM 10879]